MNIQHIVRTPARPAGRACFLLVLLYTLAQAIPALAGVAGPPGGKPAAPAATAILDAHQLAARLYAEGPPPRWLDDGQAQARVALRLLANAAEHGLDPSLYGAADLARRLDQLSGPAAGAAFERDLSTAMLQFLTDLHFGRTVPDYRPQPSATAGFDPVACLRQAVQDSSLAEAVEAAAPAIPIYRRVKATLAQYRALSRADPDWPPLPAAPGATGIAAGDAYEAAGLLRERLRLLGDLDAAAEADGGIYTPELARAVRRFQARHGLSEDGVLGPDTLAALAVPPAQRVAQLELTLERLRWLPPPPRGRFIVVNVPAYRLWAFDGSGDPSVAALEMRVIVGTAARTPTPLFIGEMRYLEFNPYWNVPRSIETGEIIPKLARDPAYLERNDMELVSGSGQVLRGAAGDALAALRAGSARVRQRPGPLNVLGQVKFAMPNPMNIYLHSTAAQALFGRTRRDLSHGCIRVEHPAELAQFVLADPQAWNADAVAAAMHGGRTRTVALRQTVPVLLFYATAITDRQGRALFANDIYRRDAALIRALHGSR